MSELTKLLVHLGFIAFLTIIAVILLLAGAVTMEIGAWLVALPSAAYAAGKFLFVVFRHL